MFFQNIAENIPGLSLMIWVPILAVFSAPYDNAFSLRFRNAFSMYFGHLFWGRLGVLLDMFFKRFFEMFSLLVFSFMLGETLCQQLGFHANVRRHVQTALSLDSFLGRLWSFLINFWSRRGPFGFTSGVGAVPLANQGPEDAREISGKQIFHVFRHFLGAFWERV